MNGKLYSHNLSAIANFDGANTTPFELENRILSKWASVLTGENESGLDYRLWQTILVAKGGERLSGSLQRIVLAVVEIITGEKQPSGWTIEMLVSQAAESGGGPTPPVEQCFTLIGQTECFTLIGSADPFDLIQ
jgi:hypothetical protein